LVGQDADPLELGNEVFISELSLIIGILLWWTPEYHEIEKRLPERDQQFRDLNQQHILVMQSDYVYMDIVADRGGNGSVSPSEFPILTRECISERISQFLL
jgi:hypothetical protein